jgi:3D (Asp-Asp-Asp) domain-containing protein
LIPKNNLQIAKRKVYKNFYVVERGDTLTKIAKITGVNVTRLIKYNNLIIGTIRVGQKIYLTANNYKEKTINNTKIVNKTIPVAKPILKPVQKKVLAKKTIKTTMPKTVALVKHTKKTVAKTIATTKHTKILTTLIKPEKIKSENIKKLASKAKNTIKPVRQIKVTATAYTSHSGQTDETPFLAAWNNRIRPGMKIIAVSRDLIKKYGLTNGVKVRLKGFPGYYIVRDKMNKRFKSRIDIYMGMNKHKALQWGKKRVVLMW